MISALIPLIVEFEVDCQTGIITKIYKIIIFTLFKTLSSLKLISILFWFINSHTGVYVYIMSTIVMMPVPFSFLAVCQIGFYLLNFI